MGFHGGVNRNLETGRRRAPGAITSIATTRRSCFADQHVGRVLKALNESPHAGTTIVALTSDHGESLGEHDYFFDHGDDLFNPSLRIPLVLSFPGFLPAGERVSGAVSTLDIYPPSSTSRRFPFHGPPGLQGSSVLPLIRGTRSTPARGALLPERSSPDGDLERPAQARFTHPAADGSAGCLELYDMYRDPARPRTGTTASESHVAPLEAELGSFHTRTVAWQQETTAKRSPATADAALSEATRRSLEVLGYVQENASPAPVPCRGQ